MTFTGSDAETTKIRGLSLSLLLGLVTTLSACSPQQMFSGPSKQKAEIAIVRGWGVQLLSVNNNRVGVNSSGVVILPGLNRFKITPNASNYHDTRGGNPVYTLDMQALAGVEYAITTKRGDGRLCAFPLNPNNGEPNFSEPKGCASK